MSTKIHLERMLTVETVEGFTTVQPRVRAIGRALWWGLFGLNLLNAGYSLANQEWQIAAFSAIVAGFLLVSGWMGWNAARMEYERDVVLGVLKSLGVQIDRVPYESLPEDPRMN